MSITVNSAGAAVVYDQPEVSFEVNPDDTLTVAVPDGTIAIYADWDSVTDDQFDVAVVTTPPVPGAPVATTVNPAPPEPTPHAEVEPDADDAPPVASVPADGTTAPGTPVSTVGTPASTTDTSASDVVIPSGPGGTTIGSPASPTPGVNLAG